MTSICGVFAVAFLGTSTHDSLGDWHIWMTITSGWAAPTGVYVDSNGRNTAYSDRSDRRIVTDLRAGVPASFCEHSPLSKYQVRKIAFRILTIPDDVLEEGILSISGNCEDDIKKNFTLRVYDRDFHFAYSDENHCRNGRDVPDWLLSLASALQVRYQEIKGCDEMPLTTESSP